jgi:hypothetical protein
MTTKEQQQLTKIIDEIIETSMEQIQFLIKNHKLISNMSKGKIRTDKVDNFRSGIALVYMAGLNKGILANRDCNVVISLLDAEVVNEAILDFQIALYKEKCKIV